MNEAASGGPLAGMKVLEAGGIGPGPFAAMLLAEMGADVVRFDRPGQSADDHHGMGRGKRSIALDLKSEAGRGAALTLIDRADALIEGFRPGVMERLGLGPEVALERNPRLAYGRMTGWGQEGPLAQAVGHDLNYIALSGLLHAMGRKGSPPAPPLNVVGDFGGGALYLVMGLLAAVLHARASGRGQVVDCAIVDGAASLGGLFRGLRAEGVWSEGREDNLLDGGAPFYDVYECAEGGFVSVAAVEPGFYAVLRERLGLDGDERFDGQYDRRAWPEQKAALTALFLTRTREDWCAALEGSEACFAPVLSFAEAPGHPHNRARGVFAEGAVAWPAAAPRFSATPGAASAASPTPGADGEAVLRDWLG